MSARIFALLLTFILFAFPVYAAPVTCNPKLPESNTNICPAGLDQIANMFQQFITVFVGFGFVVLLIMLIVAGFKYLTSGGEPKAVSAAHQTFSWALLGLFFMAIAWIILLLIKQFTGVDVFIFNVKSLCGDPTARIPFPFCQPKP